MIYNDLEIENRIESCIQNPKNSSTLEIILELIPILTDHTHLAKAHFILGKYYQLNDDPNKALAEYDNVLIYEKYDDEIDIKSKAYSNIGIIYLNKGNFEKSKNYFLCSLEYKYQLKNEQSYAPTYINLGTVCLKLEEHIEALRYYEKAQSIYTIQESNLMVAHCIFSQGIIYHLNENHEKAIEYYIDALTLTSINEDKELYIRIHIHLGEVYTYLTNFVSAEKYLKKGLEFSKKEKYQLGEVNSNALLSSMYLKENKLDLAKKYSEDTLLIEHENFFDAHSACHMNLGVIYFKKDEKDLANMHFIKSLEITDKYNLLNRKRELLPYLIDFYTAYQDYKSAFHYLKTLQNLKDEYSNKKLSTKLAEIQFNEEKERIEKENQWHEQKNFELEKEKKKSDSLLKNILPNEVAEELKNTGSSKAVLYEDVTVIFTDFHEFSKVSRLLDATALVAELHECFKAFDEIIKKYDIEKIKTVGDAYIAVSGLPKTNENHATEILKAAVEIKAFMNKRKQQLGDKTFNIRIGIHSGPVVAGIVGVTKFAYDIWGDTVNTAARLEQHAPIGGINLSETTYHKIKEIIPCTFTGEIDAKNIGIIKTYTPTL